MTIEKSPRVERLKVRAKHCCCKYCGSELHVRQIIFQTQADARIELYCDQCQKIEYGVEKEVYASAKAFVQARPFYWREVFNLPASQGPSCEASSAFTAESPGCRPMGLSARVLAEPTGRQARGADAIAVNLL